MLYIILVMNYWKLSFRRGDFINFDAGFIILKEN